MLLESLKAGSQQVNLAIMEMKNSGSQSIQNVMDKLGVLEKSARALGGGEDGNGGGGGDILKMLFLEGVVLVLFVF